MVSVPLDSNTLGTDFSGDKVRCPRWTTGRRLAHDTSDSEDDAGDNTRHRAGKKNRPDHIPLRRTDAESAAAVAVGYRLYVCVVLVIRGRTISVSVSAPVRMEYPSPRVFPKNTIPNRPKMMDGIPEGSS